jgi:putative selenate reductase FAD-binding subunit
MIIEYHRPETQAEAIALISRKEPRTVLLGGGLYLNEVVQDPIAVVDVQGLDINKIEFKGKNIHLGGGASLQSVLDQDQLPPALAKSIQHQETRNRRQVATVAGSIVAGGGRSPVLCVLLALDAELVLQGKDKSLERHQLGDFLPFRGELLAGKLITEIIIPTQVKGIYDFAARSAADLPIVAVAVASWPSGRTRVVLGGYGDQPRMAFDGPESKGADIAARDAYSGAADQWASAEYRSQVAGVLVRRCLIELADNN